MMSTRDKSSTKCNNYDVIRSVSFAKLCALLLISIIIANLIGHCDSFARHLPQHRDQSQQIYNYGQLLPQNYANQWPIQSIPQNSDGAIFFNPKPKVAHLRAGTSGEASSTDDRPGDLLPVSSSSSTDALQMGPISGGVTGSQQVAEWPFIMSLQSNKAKNNALQSGIVSQFNKPAKQKQPPSLPQRELNLVTSGEQPTIPSRSEAEMAGNTMMSNGIGGPLPSLQANSLTERASNSSLISLAPLMASTTTTTSTTSTSTTPRPEVNKENDPLSSGELSEDVTEPPMATSEAPQPQSPDSSRAPAAIAKDPSTGGPLFAPDFHASIQKAVERIVKMTADSLVSSTTQAPQPQQASQLQPQPQQHQQPQKSSLSLNVLLKNFGIKNLSNLDQILLKSSLNQRPMNQSDDTTGSGNTTTSVDPKSEQRIAISGLQLMQPANNSTGDNSNSSNIFDSSMDYYSQDQGAECRIEYTLKHVNVSLSNSAKGDYNCDYIIDRKMATQSAASITSGSPNEINGSSETSTGKNLQVCRLQLMSNFFSNEPSQNCNGTYLALGASKFCYRSNSLQTATSQVPLNQSFEFPLEKEAFDIRMVHKQQDVDKENSEIYLEVKPQTDESCRLSESTSPDNGSQTGSELNPSTRNELQSVGGQNKPPTGELSMAEAPPPISSISLLPNQPVASAEILRDTSREPRRRQDASSSRARTELTQGSPLEGREEIILRQPAPSNPRRKLFFKTPSGSGHFKVSQTFDIGNQGGRGPGARPDVGASLAGIPSVTGEVLTSQVMNIPDSATLGARSTQLPVFECDPSSRRHSALMGQIKSPEYPNLYPANANCSYTIERHSNDYCQVLLQFRDFDLIQAPTSSDPPLTSNREVACPGDYLQIGATRYCNKYAMIGHKMRLDFPPVSEGPLRLTFRSDLMRSGRGFLVRYQQLACVGVSQGQQETPARGGQRQQQVPSSVQQRWPAGRMSAAAVSPAGSVRAQLLAQQFVVPATSGTPTPSQQRTAGTLAPANREPDFGLALRTTAEPPTPKLKTPVGEAATATATATATARRAKSPQPQSQPTGGGASNGSNLAAQASTVSSALLLGQAPLPLDAHEDNNQAVRRQQHTGSGCNQVSGDLNFVLISPNYPNEYDSNLECSYYIRRNSSSVCYVELTFVKFDLEADVECRFDYFEINGVRLCGSLKDLGQHKTTRIYLFEEPIKVIKFRSDASSSRSGFLIRAEQLECDSGGAILRDRQPKEPSRTSSLPATRPRLTSGSANARSSSSLSSTGERQTFGGSPSRNRSVIEYDFVSSSRPAASGSAINPSLNFSTNLSPTRTSPSPASRANGFDVGSIETGSGCDETFSGRQAIIKSPLWPNSYLGDDSLSSCRYTILRAPSSLSNKICQLELRFVTLRLGTGDCLDVGGFELLCGFNVRNTLKYYPLDSQSQLTITFLSGAKSLAQARRAKSSRRGDLNSREDFPPPDDELIHSRAPPRFLIVARQHECIDGFLAPQTNFAVGYNQTNLLYSSSSLPASSQSGRPSSSPKSTPQTNNNPALIKYDFSSTTTTNNQRDEEDSSLAKTPKATLMYSLSSGGQQPTSGQPTSGQSTSGQWASGRPAEQPGAIARPAKCLHQLTQFSGLLSSQAVSTKIRSSSGGECLIQMKLLTGFCRLQLSFTDDFELYPRSSSTGLCPLEYLEIPSTGVKFCANELKNISFPLDASLTSDGRAVELLFVSPASRSSAGPTTSGFKAFFKQLECQQPASNNLPKNSTVSFTEDRMPLSQVPRDESQVSSSRSESESSQKVPKIDYQEILIKDELFEMSSQQLSSSSRRNSSGYEPNMFVVYRVRKSQPKVCKLRLLFYKFDLEPSLGCKRDFFDINNSDRLCGKIYKPEETQKDYNWPLGDRDFVLSFVSDSSDQRDGYLIFGQQLSANCFTMTITQPPATDKNHQEPASATFDDAQSDQTPMTGSGPKATQSERQGQQAASQRDMADEAKRKEDSMTSRSCFELFSTNKFQLTSPNWPQKYQAGISCHYLIQKADDATCSVTLNVVSMILGGPLKQTGGNEDDFLSAASSDIDRCTATSGERPADSLEIDGQLFCGIFTRPRQVTIHFGERRFISAKFTSSPAVESAGFGYAIEGTQNRCTQNQNNVSSSHDQEPSWHQFSSMGSHQQPEVGRKAAVPPGQHFNSDAIESSTRPAPSLSCNRLILETSAVIESENFPLANYKHRQDCLYVIRRPNKSVCALDLSLNHFDLEDSSDLSGICERDYLELDHSRLCGSSFAPGHKIRFDFFDWEQEKLLKFRSDASVSRSGFSVTVRQVAGSECSSHESSANEEPLEPEVTAKKTQVVPSRPLIASGDSTLTSTGSQRQPLSTLCQFVYHSAQQFIESPGYIGPQNGSLGSSSLARGYENNLDCEYKIVAKSYDYCALKLRLLDLDLETSGDCHKDYLLVDNRRLCSTSDWSLNSELLIEFNGSLPREVHLLLHTDSQGNEGRGFRLHYQQVACDISPPHKASLASQPELGLRELRRTKFGQLKYPNNYVSGSYNSKQIGQGDTLPNESTPVASNSATTGQGERPNSDDHYASQMTLTSGSILVAREAT